MSDSDLSKDDSSAPHTRKPCQKPGCGGEMAYFDGELHCLDCIKREQAPRQSVKTPATKH